MKKLIVITIILMVVFAISLAYAGEKEDLKVAFLQEHIKALQLDFQISQDELKKAIAEKEAADKKDKPNEGK